MNNKIILGVFGLFIIAFAMIILNLYLKEKIARKNAESISVLLVDNVKKKTEEDIKTALIDIKKHNTTIDSLNTAYADLEIKNKLKNKYYERKISQLKNVNTFARRSAYADSLERAINSGTIGN